MAFADRLDAGRQLAARLAAYKWKKGVVVLGIPRGGVEVAYAIAKELRAELGLVVAKKIPFPGNPELAIGAVSFGGAASMDEGFALQGGVGKDYFDDEKKRLAAEIKRRYAAYKTGFPEVKGKIAIVVDDGIATGHTVLAAVKAVRKGLPLKVVVAVPVSSVQASWLLKKEVDAFVCLAVPEFFMAVGEFYRSFPQLSDEDVMEYIRKS